jgi:uncharacterized protein
MKKYIDRLNEIFDKNNVCKSHGILHAIKVMNNADLALSCAKFKIDDTIKLSILLAALLHDADDKKFFPNNLNFENLRFVLSDYDPELINLIIKMVDLVSSSKNGDNIPDEIKESKEKEWLLYPRYADRLEAIGIEGIERCYQYALTTNNNLFVSTTPCPSTEEDIWKFATIERYNNYHGKSQSMIDHYYDKLLRATFFPIKNEFFDYESNKRRKPLIDFLIYFSKNKTICNQDVENFIANYK